MFNCYESEEELWRLKQEEQYCRKILPLGLFVIFSACPRKNSNLQANLAQNCIKDHLKGWYHLQL